MKLIFTLALAANLLAVHAGDARQDFLVRQGGVSVNVDDIDAIADNIPDDLRFGVMDDPNRIAGYLQTIVLHRAIAADARRHGLDQDPSVKREIEILGEGVLAKHYLRRQVVASPSPDYERMAAEHYQANREKFRRPDGVDVSHILVSSKTRSDQESLARAREAREKLLADPDSLEALVREYSDDPSAPTNSGRFKKVAPGQMLPQFEQAAFALAEPGDVSEPVRTRFGYHLIVLHRKYPGVELEFDEVKPRIVAELKKKHREQMASDLLDRYGGESTEIDEEAMRAIAAEARRDGVSEDPLVIREIEIGTEGILAKHYVQRQLAAMPSPDYEKLASEHYRANRDKFRHPATIDVSHILVATEDRDDETALARAREAREKLIADPDSLEALVSEYSDDPSAATNRGRLKQVGRGRMVPEFEAAAFALTQPGDVSDPVRTKFGYHVVVLHQKHPSGQLEFEEVKAAIIADLAKKHDEQMRSDFLDRYRAQPMEVNEEAVLALRTRYAGSDG